jgi:hypothetical protein
LKKEREKKKFPGGHNTSYIHLLWRRPFKLDDMLFLVVLDPTIKTCYRGPFYLPNNSTKSLKLSLKKFNNNKKNLTSTTITLNTKLDSKFEN